ncbi:MAG: type II glyceraldehyde-3-phosphate dehydrogenase [Candidatus Marsarchaeota archaeon]|nr:type II glyceraldehyde-3-phosphate dehydrogenase [Candidatus Marsarchaeota archaeon]MCL5412793.1 type II glyceraldehyde-3-phosphate dehydrogenase [Candidatus Marsarchaeota archaeon]
MVRVGVNGYGVIGRRIAYAVSKQDDMELVGIAKGHPDYKAKLASAKGFKIYSSDLSGTGAFDRAGVVVSGTIDDLLQNVDIIVDCTPEGIGEKNKPLYEKAGCRAIWQGGEEHSISGLSFNAYANYGQAFGARYARVVSCNTTGLLRTLFPLKAAFGIKSVNAFLVRRAADPSETKKGPINALELEKQMPSHHGDDVKTVIPELNISTTAIKASTTLMHIHHVTVELGSGATSDELLDAWSGYRRIVAVSARDGLASTAHLMDMARDMGRGMGDLYEIAVWKEMLVDGSRLEYMQAVHQESDVVPENVDAIRAMCSIEKDAAKSIEKTDRSLGIGLSL